MTFVKYYIRYATDKTNLWGDEFEAEDGFKQEGRVLTFYTKSGHRVYNFDYIVCISKGPIFKQLGEL